MNGKRHITGFYIETLLLISVFMVIVLLLTGVFGMGKNSAAGARLLTNAVCLSQNAAEAVAGSESAEELLLLLNENKNAEKTAGGVSARYSSDMEPDAGGPVEVRVSWEPEGNLVKSRIEVFYRGGASPVYELDTAVYLRGKGAVS